MRTGSLVVDLTERSSLGAVSSSTTASGSAAARLALDDVDAEIGEDAVDLLELFRREIDVAQRVVDVGAVEVALLTAFFEKHAHLVGAQQRRGRRTVVRSSAGSITRRLLLFVTCFGHQRGQWRSRWRAEHVHPVRADARVPRRAGAVTSGRQADR